MAATGQENEILAEGTEEDAAEEEDGILSAEYGEHPIDPVLFPDVSSAGGGTVIGSPEAEAAEGGAEVLEVLRLAVPPETWKEEGKDQ